MSASIETMFSANGIIPWHREGTVLPGAVAWDDAPRLAGHLSRELEKRPLYVCNNVGDTILDESRFYAVCDKATGRMYGYPVTEAQETLQCAQVSSLAAKHMAGLTCETGGILTDAHGTAWLCGSYENNSRTIGGDGDSIVMHYTVAWAPNGKAIRGFASLTRPVCSNTIHAAEREGCGDGRFSVKHTKNAIANLTSAMSNVELLQRVLDDTATDARLLAAAPVTGRRDIADFVAVVRGKPEIEAQEAGKVSTVLRDVVKRFETGAGSDLDSARGTWWGLYNALTERASHDRGGGQGRALAIAAGDGARAKMVADALKASLGLSSGISRDNMIYQVHGSQFAAGG